jgi:uncharacterized protein (DUF2336 family)
MRPSASPAPTGGLARTWVATRTASAPGPSIPTDETTGRADRPGVGHTETGRASSRTADGQERNVQTTKDRIVKLLRESGDEDKARRVERELADDLDTERDRADLERLGLDPEQLHQKLTGDGIPQMSD